MASCAEKLLWFAGRFLHLIPAETPMRVFFGINRGLRWVRDAANAPEWLGIYEFRKQRLLRRLVRPGQTVFDIGANAGFYTLGLARLVRPHGRVFAFEPLPKNILKLRRHLDLNRIDNVTLQPCALSDQTGLVGFELGDSDFTGRISRNRHDAFEVAATTLDQFVAENEIARVTLLKIDVEGAEAQVLHGAHELIARTHPTMLVAIHGMAAAHACFSILTNAGYVISSLGGATIDKVDAMPREILARYPC